MLNKLRFPPVKPTFYPLNGGLDLVTPKIAINPGRCFDAMNYEPLTVGGYKRLRGYERSDGRVKPSVAPYWLIDCTISATINVGDTVTGATSAATGVALQVNATQLVLGRVTGTFVLGENLQVGGVTKAVSTSAATQNSEPVAATSADYRLLAANNRRADILAVPGSGDIRGVWIYSDTVYAFRDNAGGTAGDMYKQTASGWQQVTFGRELQFTGAVGQVSDGQTVTGLTSGASAVVKRALLRTGSWTSAGVGTLVFATVTGAFQNGEAIQIGGVTKVTSASVDTAITRAPGGRLEFVNGNFTGSTSTERMFGADGVNLAFEFDGTTYVPIRTGMAADTPAHIVFYKNRLWLSFLGSVQFSGVGTPYAWTAVLGAGEIATGLPVSVMKVQTGAQTGSSLIICAAGAAGSSGRTFVLYGETSSDFKLVPSNDDIGYFAFSVQPVSNNLYGLTNRGIQSLVTTLSYGDFEFAAISFLIQPYIDTKRGLNVCATTLRAKNQYRIFFSDNTGLIVGLTGEKPNGIMPVSYNVPVLCVCSATLSTGEEVTYFGSSNGFVYQDNVGTSFDGAVIGAWIRPAFNNLQSPLVRKTYRRAVFEVETEGYSRVNINYDLGYGTQNVEPAAIRSDTTLSGAGGYWDQFVWDQFTWSASVISEASMPIDGTEKNISFFFYSSRAQDDPHTVQGVSLLWTPRRLERA